jgi:hypothetical protein
MTYSPMAIVAGCAAPLREAVLEVVLEEGVGGVLHRRVADLLELQVERAVGVGLDDCLGVPGLS